MKTKMKKIICIATMVVMLLSTMGVGAFAAVDQGITAQENEPATVDTQENNIAEPVAEPEPDATVEEEEPDATVEVAADSVYDYHPITTGTRTVSGHQRIKVCWPAYVAPEPTYYVIKGNGEDVPDTYYKASETLDGYILFRNDNPYGPVISPTANSTEDRSVGDGLYTYNGKLHNGGSYTYRVVARTELKADPTTPLTTEEIEALQALGADNPLSTATETTSEDIVTAFATYQNPKSTVDTAKAAAKKTGATTCVRTSAVKLKLKTNKKLTSHDKKKKTRTFKKNMTIYTCGFGIGKHMFIYGDNMYYLNRISTKSTSSITTKTAYNKETAEYFVNSRGNGSKNGKLIWVSVYTQHIYIFTGSARNWKLKYCWAVSTGKSKTPTIRTIDPQGNPASGRMIGKSKTICQKIKKRHGIPYWNCFSSYNAIHGKKAKWSIKAVPQSGGCVRNTNDHAKWVYNNCAKGTTVIIF